MAPRWKNVRPRPNARVAGGGARAAVFVPGKGTAGCGAYLELEVADGSYR